MHTRLTLLLVSTGMFGVLPCIACHQYHTVTLLPSAVSAPVAVPAMHLHAACSRPNGLQLAWYIVVGSTLTGH